MGNGLLLFIFKIYFYINYFLYSVSRINWLVIYRGYVDRL